MLVDLDTVDRYYYSVELEREEEKPALWLLEAVDR